MLVAGPVYSPTSISQFSAVTLEVEGRVRITCRHPCGFSDSSRQRFCVSMPGKPPGAGLEPPAKTKQPQQRRESAQPAPAAVEPGLQGRSDGQTAARLSNAAPCSRCVVSLLSTCLTPCRAGRLGFVPDRPHRAPRAARASPERNPSGGKLFKNSGVRSLVLWFCST